MGSSRYGRITTLKKSDGTSLAATTQTATIQSESFRPKHDYIGIGIDLGTVSGTSPTLDAKLQVSFNGGTTWQDFFPAASGNAAAQAQVPQATTTGDQKVVYVRNPFPVVARDSSINFLCRLNLVIAGTSPSFGIDNVFIFEVNEAG